MAQDFALVRQRDFGLSFGPVSSRMRSSRVNIDNGDDNGTMAASRR